MLTPELMRIELPEGYRWVQGDRGLMAVWVDAEGSLSEAGFGPDEDGSLRESGAVGRGALGELRVGSDAFLVRRFTHGGLLRWLSGPRFSDPRRPFEELLLSHGLSEVGIRTPRVVAARARRLGLWWELAVVSVYIEAATDIGRWIAEVRKGERSRDSFGDLAFAFGDLVRQLHDVGFKHADLQPNNVLVEEPLGLDEEPRLWILDLDRSQHGDPLVPAKSIENLGRLTRFVERRERERGTCLSSSDRMRFMRGYEPERSRRHEVWRALSSSVRLSGRHEFGWKMERAFGGEDPREGS